MEDLVGQMKGITNNLISARVGMELQYRKLYRSYKASVGWTTKYRNALAEANRALAEVGLPQVGVIGGNQAETDIEYPEEDEQLSLLDLMGDIRYE